MNSIRSERHKTKYSTGPHPVILVDDLPLDEFLSARFGNQNLLHLVPTLLNWLYDPVERMFTWQRIDPPLYSATLAPVLMCPDDCDLWCTVVVVEIEAANEGIYWHRFGYSDGPADIPRMPEAVCDTIEWFEPQERLAFTHSEYQACLAQFRESLE